MSNVRHVEFRPQPATLDELETIIRDNVMKELRETGFDQGVAERAADMIARLVRRPIERLARESIERGGICKSGTALGAVLEGTIAAVKVLANSDGL